MVSPGRGPAAREWVRAWKPVVAGGHEVFYDQAYFTRQFKRHVGTPPGRYALLTRGGG